MSRFIEKYTEYLKTPHTLALCLNITKRQKVNASVSASQQLSDAFSNIQNTMQECGAFVNASVLTTQQLEIHKVHKST